VPLTKEVTQDVVKKFQLHEKDSGSVEVQVALLTNKINYLTEHLKSHVKDHHSRLGLLKMVGRRRRMLEYLKKSDLEAYQALIENLNLRK